CHVNAAEPALTDFFQQTIASDSCAFAQIGKAALCGRFLKGGLGLRMAESQRPFQHAGRAKSLRRIDVERSSTLQTGSDFRHGPGGLTATPFFTSANNRESFSLESRPAGTESLHQSPRRLSPSVRSHRESVPGNAGANDGWRS